MHNYVLAEFIKGDRMVVFNGSDNGKTLTVKIYYGSEIKGSFCLETKDRVQCLYDTLGKYLEGKFNNR